MAAATPFQVSVSGLAPSRTEDSLRSLFGQHGAVQRVSVNAGGQAVIVFAEKTAAEAAVAELNGKVLDGLEVRVAIDVGASPDNATVYVRDLPKDCTDGNLRDALQTFGAIRSIRMDAGKGYGFVQFDSAESASRALSESSVCVLSSHVRIEKFISKTDRKTTTSSVYVRGFDSSYTEQQLKAVFARFGEISSCTINREAQGGTRVYGFVNFVQQEAAEAALKLSGQTVEGVAWFVSPAAHPSQGSHAHRPQNEDWTKRNIYISGFPAYVTQTNIQALCQTFGEIESIRMIQRSPLYGYEDTEGQEGSGAFVCFKREQDADTAISALRHTLIERCRVKVSKWKPLETRKVVGTPQALMGQWPFGMPFGFYPPPTYRYDRPQHYHGQRRNQHQLKHAPQAAQPQAAQPTLSQFDLAKYNAQATAADKKRMIGEYIFYHLSAHYKESTGKITGMLLEMPQAELLDIAQNASALLVKAAEAMEVLRRHTQASKK